jgi:WD40 repeat protein
MRAVIFLACLLVPSIATAREWTDSTGQFKIEAEFAGLKDGKVQLRKPDGTFVAIPLDKLSKLDQDFVAAFSKPAADNPFEAVPSPMPGGLVKIAVRPGQEGKPGEVRRFPEQGWGISSLAFSPTGGVLAAGKPDRALQLFDVSEEAKLDFQEKLEFLGKISACAFTPDGARLLVGSEKGIVQLYDATNPRSLKALHQFAGHSQEITCLAVSADGKLAASGGAEKRLRLWTVADGREVAVFNGFEGPIKALLITPDGKLALGTDGALLLSIDIDKKEIVGRGKLTGSWAAGQCAAFSPDGKWVAAGDSYKLRLWDLKTGKEQKAMEAGDIQWSCAFTPDGKRLLSGASAAINVWDVPKQAKIAALPTAGSGYIQTIAPSPDNLHAAAITSSAGQTLQVFRLPGVE